MIDWLIMDFYMVTMEEPFSATWLADLLNIQIQLSKSMTFTFLVHLAKPL